jgi:hypothetical protein
MKLIDEYGPDARNSPEDLDKPRVMFDYRVPRVYVGRQTGEQIHGDSGADSR